MVKNTTGGNKAKQQGRRFAINASQAVTSVRKAVDKDEMYAVVSKIFGGKFCQVTCQDGMVRRCSIRKKFMARRRGENNVAVGIWVLVGLYDWEVKADGSQTCDLLEVYSAAEKDCLKQQEKNCNFMHLLKVGDEADQETVAFSSNSLLNDGDDGDNGSHDKDVVKPVTTTKSTKTKTKVVESSSDNDDSSSEDDDAIDDVVFFSSENKKPVIHINNNNKINVDDI
jgi:translation initiation factor IF-1